MRDSRTEHAEVAQARRQELGEDRLVAIEAVRHHDGGGARAEIEVLRDASRRAGDDAPRARRCDAAKARGRPTTTVASHPSSAAMPTTGPTS